jgi:hypothetical protein
MAFLELQGCDPLVNCETVATDPFAHGRRLVAFDLCSGVDLMDFLVLRISFLAEGVGPRGALPEHVAQRTICPSLRTKLGRKMGAKLGASELKAGHVRGVRAVESA